MTEEKLPKKLVLHHREVEKLCTREWVMFLHKYGGHSKVFAKYFTCSRNRKQPSFTEVQCV